MAWHRSRGNHTFGALARRARPQWLSPEQLEQMRQFYLEARRLTQETGVKHEVDHVHPLKGETCCGLHVPWNLQILTASENRRKKNRLAVGAPSER